MSRSPDLDTQNERSTASRLYRLLLTKDGRRRGEAPGHESAGRILAVMLVTFAGAALVNADAMVERAERKPLGDDRDRALAIWHPVQDVAHVLQLDHLRTFADDVATDILTYLRDPGLIEPLLADARKMVVDQWGEEAARGLFETNPRAIIDSEPLPWSLR